MKKDWKYITYLSTAILFYLMMKLFSPRELDWTITYHHADKNPFGGYVLNNFIGSVFTENLIHKSNYTLYELYDSLQKPVNFISISTRFNPGKEDVNALLKNIERGGTAFIAAQYFNGLFADTLSLNTSDYFFDSAFGAFNQNDTSSLTFKNPAVQPSLPYRFPRNNIHNYFSESDSTSMVVVENDLNLPVTIKINLGKGALYLNSTPLSFTNAYLLHENNFQFAELSLSHLPNRETYWTEFYHLGRLEARTPLRFILSTEPLRWAYYITTSSVLLFILFEIKRRQRIIPIVNPLSNTSIEFVNTVANLYYQSNDHKNIAEKRIRYMFEQLLSIHSIHTQTITDEMITVIARKTGNTEGDVHDLFSTIQSIRVKKSITSDELIDLNKKIDRFKY